MTAPLIYSAAPVLLNATKLAALDVSVPPNIAEQAFQHSGNLFASIEAFSGAVPRVTFKTPAKDAISLIGTGILALTTFELYATKFSASTFTKTGTGTHTKWATSSACAIISGWSVDQNGILLADVEVVPFSADGAAYPLTRTDNNDMITLASEPLLHTLGPIKINNSVVTGLNQLTVSLGNQVDVRISDGDLYPRTAALLSGSPTISGTHMDPLSLTTAINQQGVAISSSTIAYWKSYDATTQVVSVSNSISATIASGRIRPTSFNMGQNVAARAGFSITPLSSSSTHPLVISTSATTPAT